MQIAFEDVSFSYTLPHRRSVSSENISQGTSKTRMPGAEEAVWGADPDNAWALSGITFELQSGESLGIAGHTGSGKSTLIQLLCGFLNPSSGHVYFNGSDMAEKQTAREAMRSIGVVFQYPESQLFAETVFDDIAYGPRNYGLSEEEVKTRADEACDLVGLDLDAIGTSSPFELSGGEQRRVAIAGVLAISPDILVLDEPTSGLDPHSREEFLQLLEGFRDVARTVVTVSHDIDMLARISDRIIVLSRGRIFSEGTPAQVFSDEESLERAGISIPAAQRIANRLMQAGIVLDHAAGDAFLYDENMLADDIAAKYMEGRHA